MIRGVIYGYKNGGICVAAYPFNRKHSEFKLYVTEDVFKANRAWIWNAILEFASSGQVTIDAGAPVNYLPEYIIDGRTSFGKFYCNNCDIGNVKITHIAKCESFRSLCSAVNNPRRKLRKLVRDY